MPITLDLLDREDEERKKRQGQPAPSATQPPAPGKPITLADLDAYDNPKAEIKRYAGALGLR